MADGRLRPTENHILRLLADVLGVSIASFKTLYESVTTQPLPDPSDLSSPEAWSGQRSHTKKKKKRGSSKSTSGTSQARTKLLDILGLTDEATQDDIRAAYRRLAQIHHPDRFSSLGAEAVESATKNFQQISQAYQALLKG